MVRWLRRSQRGNRVTRLRRGLCRGWGMAFLTPRCPGRGMVCRPVSTGFWEGVVSPAGGVKGSCLCRGWAGVCGGESTRVQWGGGPGQSWGLERLWPAREWGG